MNSRVALRVLAPVGAVAFALLVSSVALALSGNDPITAYREMVVFGARTDKVISIIDRAIPLYISGLAVAVGFKMALFNIGVEGQYRLAALLAAAAGAAVTLPAVLHIPFILVVAMATGAAWSGIAGVLKVTRGVHEVISTIMLNAIATGLGAYLLSTYFKATGGAATLDTQTEPLPNSGRFPTLNPLLEAVGVDPPAGSDLYGFLVVAVLLGVGYYVLIWRTRFGYDLRATGLNPWAAQASGVAPKAMVVRTMMLSGAIAGLVGMPSLLGFFHRYTLDFTTGLGFAGIAVALLGRNHPIGVAVSALLFGFLDVTSQVLDLKDIPKEIVDITQASIILSVVVAYEVARRLIQAQEAKATAAALEHGDDMPSPVEQPA